MLAFLSHSAPTQHDNDEWQAEKVLWGIESLEDEKPEQIELWEENLSVVEWWLSIPSFLKWNFNKCVGMDVIVVKADAEMAQREINPDDYRKLKVIARTVTEELNRREQ